MNNTNMNMPEAMEPGGDAVLRDVLRAARVVARCLSQRLVEAGVTPPQLEVLDALAREDGLSMRRLRDALCCVGSNVTALVDRMERLGLVERRRDSTDRRVVRIHLTQAGWQRVRLVDSPLQCCPDAICGLAAEERSALSLLLRRVVESLQAGCPEDDCCGADLVEGGMERDD